VHRLLEAGVLVTVNSDDPTPFNCSLADEFRTLAGYPGPSMEELTMRAVDASWMTPLERSRLREVVATWWSVDGLEL
jgi:adenosine deaminase